MIFIIEYKASHKLTLSYIYEGLEDMDLNDVICCHKTDSAQDNFCCLITAVITQIFSYMVWAELEYGYICTGKAFIFM